MYLKLSFIAAALLLCIAPALAQAQSNGPGRLGINLNAPNDWNTELPFVDLFKTSRPWISQREGSGWGTGPELAIDEHGWVKSLEDGCYAEALLTTVANGKYPSGEYTVLYDGDGEIRINGAKTSTQVEPGKMKVDVDSATGGFSLQLRKTNPQNPVKNIRVILPGFAETYQAQPFHPNFIARWKGVACFRFMDWMLTNDSTLTSWETRPKPDDATWSPKGIPIEVMIDLCNRQHADAWLNMPATCEDSFVQGMAAYVKNHLDPALKVHIEYSNEVWNSGFASNHYAAAQAKELGMGKPEMPWEGACLFYGQRSMQIFKIWEDVFGGHDRLVRTLAWQAASGEWWLDGMLLSKVDAKHVDALAIAPYITFCPPDHADDAKTLDASKVAAMSVDQVMDLVEKEKLPECIGWIQSAAKVAKKYNVQLVAYEGGQHLVGILGAENNEPLAELFHTANRSERMGKAYAEYYKAWDAAGGGLLCHFSGVCAWSKWGSWGLAEFYDQGPADFPKYKATVDWANGHGQNMSLDPVVKSSTPSN